MPTFGHRVFAALKAAKLANPATTVDGYAEVINKLLAAEKPARKQKPLNAMSEQEFLEFLEADPALKGLDIQKEIGKCQYWSRVNNVTASRKRICNWLMRADKPLGFDGEGKSSFGKKPDGVPPPPLNWKQRLDADIPENQITSWEYLYKNYPDIARKYML